jgi:alanine transaminase
LALVQCPDNLLDQSKQDALHQLYPGDAIQRAKEICANVTSLGAYSHSKGIPFIRKNVAEFIEQRDGYPSDPECIFLTDGASDGIKRILNLLIRDENDGVTGSSFKVI